MEVFFGFIAGVVSYMLTTFIMEPIVRYRDVRHQILRDLVMYANVLLDMTSDPKEGDPVADERRRRNREHSAELQAVIVRLPWFYREWLASRGEDPQVAAENLIGLSNKYRRGEPGEFDAADRCVKAIKKALRAEKLAV